MSYCVFIDDMTIPHQTIFIQPSAPRKPALGADCNGCGVCCLVAPCPLGVVLSGRRSGACDALRWESNPSQGPGGVYRCGAIGQPTEVLLQALPGAMTGIVPVLAWGLGRLAKRWVAVGKGCDSSVEVAEPHGEPGARMPHD